MPISYRIDPKRNLVLVEGSGVVTDKDLLEFRSSMVNDPLFQSDMKELSDFRSVERHEHNREGYRKFIEQEISLAGLLGDYYIAIVTGSDLHFGFSRIYKAQVLEVLPHVNVFRDMDEAKAWLFEESEEIDADR